MTPEEQRIAIATACGWTDIHDWKAAGVVGIDPCDKARDNIPDYLDDLNAMHEAEKVLTEDQWGDYVNWHLRCTVAAAKTNSRIKCSVYPMPGEIQGLVHATAAQRAEAFLRTLNLWTDAP